MKLKIVIHRHGKIKSIYADEEINYLTVGDTEITKGVSIFIRSVYNLVQKWPEKLVAEKDKARDCGYKMVFEENGVLKSFEAEGAFPDDFGKLSNLIFSYEDPVLYKTQQMELMTYEKE